MELPIIDISLNQSKCEVVKIHAPPLAVGCVVCVISPGHDTRLYTRNWFARWIRHRRYSWRVVQTLRALQKEGMELFLFEDMDNIGEPSALFGRKTNRLITTLRRAGADVVGADNKSLASRMTHISDRAISMVSDYENRLGAIRHCMAAALDLLQDNATSNLAAHRLELDVYREDPRRQALALLELQVASGVSFPSSIDRVIRGLACGAQLDLARIDKERTEIFQRIKRNRDFAVLSSGRPTRFQVASERLNLGADMKLALNTQRGAVRLAKHQIDALKWCSNVIQALQMSGVDGTQDVWTGTRNAALQNQSFARGSLVTHGVAQMYSQIIDVARLLGIDMLPYPNFRAYGQHCCLIAAPSGTDVNTHISNMLVAAWAYLERHLCDNDQKRAVFRSIGQYWFLRKLCQLRLLPLEVRTANLGGSENLAVELIAGLKDLGVSVDRHLVSWGNEIGSTLDDYCLYYDLATQRSVSMARRTVSAMAERKLSKAVLVILGYHVEAVAELLASLDVAVVVLQASQ